MNESKHTPVPWLVIGDTIMASGQPLKLQGRTQRAIANRSLVEAAPELLKEIKHLVKLLEPLEREGSLDVPGLATLNGVRAAIAKAEAR